MRDLLEYVSCYVSRSIYEYSHNTSKRQLDYTRSAYVDSGAYITHQEGSSLSKRTMDKFAKRIQDIALWGFVS